MKIEKGFIGQLLLSPEYIDLLEITPEVLTDMKCKIIFETMLKLKKDGKTLDVVSIGNLLNVENFTDFIKDIITETPISSEELLRSYERSIKENYIIKQIKNQVFKISSLVDLGEMQNEINKLSKLANYSADDNELSAHDGAMKFYNELHKKKEYIKTGFSRMDKLTFISKGDFIVIGGRPSAGKTAFALELASHMAKKLNVVFFSLETSNEKIYDRLMTKTANVDFSKIKNRNIENDDKKKIVEAIDTVSGLNFVSVKASGYTVGKIKAKALKLKADVIFIDYLGLLKSDGKSRYEKVTNISLDLHTLAQSLGITVIALSQLNREGTGKPTMEDLRESGQIEQDADLILLLHNDKENDKYSVIIAKNKEGEVGYIPFKFYGSTQKFYEVDYGV